MRLEQLYKKFTFDIGKNHIDGRQFICGLSLGIFATAFYGLRKYFQGGKCSLWKDLSGKNIVITGGNTGIGRQTAKKLLLMNANVFIGARDQRKNKQAVQQLKKLNKGKIYAFKLDLSEKDSIENFARDIKQSIGSQPLHYLINNAGVLGIQNKQLTSIGLQMQIGINYFGHFYLTYLLWDKLKQSTNPRIVNVSARAHKSITHNFDLQVNNLNFQKGNYSPIAAYSRSKKANIIFTKELQCRMDEAGINGVSVSLHPGVIYTQLVRYLNASYLFKVVNFLLYPFLRFCEKSVSQGAQTTIYCILQTDENLIKGGYYSDCKPALIQSPQVQSALIAKYLWKQAQKAFDIQFKV